MPGKPTLSIKLMKGRLVFPLSLVLFLMVAPRVNAHGINVTARVEGDRILTESYFSNKIKVIDGQIKVYDPNGEQLLEGKTDANGIFSFKIPQETDLKIVLESAMGHRAEYVLQADDYRRGRDNPGAHGPHSLPQKQKEEVNHHPEKGSLSLRSVPKISGLEALGNKSFASNFESSYLPTTQHADDCLPITVHRSLFAVYRSPFTVHPKFYVRAGDPHRDADGHGDADGILYPD
jgi:nickel transport protein